MKKLLGLLVFALLVTGCTNASATATSKPAFIFVDDRVLYIELGNQEATFTNEEIFTDSSNTKYFETAVIDYAAINRDTLGTYPLNITITDESEVTKKMYVDVVVRDTTAPTLEVKNVVITEGDSVDINSFIVSNDDKQMTEVVFTTDVDLTSVGSRDYVIASTDASGNRTEKTVNITVEAKAVVNTWTPSSNGGGSSWTPPVNNGGGGATPAPVTPSVPYVVSNYNCVGTWGSCIEQAMKNAPQFSTGSVDPARMSDGSDSTTHFLITYY